MIARLQSDIAGAAVFGFAGLHATHMNSPDPILEVAILNVRAEVCDEFETAFREASAIISSMPGYLSHELRRCVEVSNRYVLLVHWAKLEDHTVGFRQSPQYQRWRGLLHHFYDPFPTVEHYGSSILATAG